MPLPMYRKSMFNEQCEEAKQEIKNMPELLKVHKVSGQVSFLEKPTMESMTIESHWQNVDLTSAIQMFMCFTVLAT